MTVVADTTPLNYLVLIGEVDLLPVLFGRVIVPRAAWQELQHPRTPLRVRKWASHPPLWIEMRTVASVPNLTLMHLDMGEREAIHLALEQGVDTLLIDEAEGRQAAQKLHLQVRGTLGILEQGARLGLVDFREALRKIDLTTFRMSPAVRRAFLERNTG